MDLNDKNKKNPTSYATTDEDEVDHNGTEDSQFEFHPEAHDKKLQFDEKSVVFPTLMLIQSESASCKAENNPAFKVPADPLPRSADRPIFGSQNQPALVVDQFAELIYENQFYGERKTFHEIREETRNHLESFFAEVKNLNQDEFVNLARDFLRKRVDELTDDEEYADETSILYDRFSALLSENPDFQICLITVMLYSFRKLPHFKKIEESYYKRSNK